MTTGLTPLLNRLIANGECVLNVDPASGSYIPITGNFVPSIAGGAYAPKLIRGGTTGAGGMAAAYIEYPDFVIPSGEITIAMVLIPGPGVANYPYHIYDGKCYLYYSAGSSRFAFSSNGAVAVAYSAINSCIVGKKVTVVVTRTNANPSLANFYVDGVISGTANQSTGTIAAGTQNVRCFVGQISGNSQRLLVFSRALNAVEVSQFTAELNSIVYETQDCFWPVSTTVYWRGAFGALASETAMAAGRSIGDINELVVASGTHKMSTEKLDGILTKCLVCVTNGTINLPAYNLGTNYVFEKFTASTGLWTTVTQASRAVALLAGDKILWANQTGNRHIKRIY